MFGPFVHNIDPIFTQVGGFYLWYYGLSYTLGFIGVFLWLRRKRKSLDLKTGEVYSLSIFLASGVLLGGRIVEVIFYEWAYYGSHILYIPALWLGGMSTHGIILGAVVGTIFFGRFYKKDFLRIADVLAIAGAFIMGVGRIGNFIDGQILGSVTDVPWAVKFPDAEGFRHPVMLYDGLKNLLLIPFLLLIRRSQPPRGVVLAHFIVWYGFLRIFIDFLREYQTTFLGFPPGQEFNLSMTVLGLYLLYRFYRRSKSTKDAIAPSFPPGMNQPESMPRTWIKRVVFVLLLLFPLIIPSDWTQDIPSRYGKRHEGLNYSVIYPRIVTSTSLIPPEKKEK